MKKSSRWLPDLGRRRIVLVVRVVCSRGRSPHRLATVFCHLVSGCLVIAVMRTLFPPGRLFPIAFASLLAVYAAIFSLFVEEVFRGLNDVVLAIGFCLPIAFFVIGCGLRRDRIRTLVDHPTIRSEQRVLRATAWLVPVFLIGATVVLLSHALGPFLNSDVLFLGAMSLIGLIVVVVSRDVAIFLVDAGLLFNEFFRRVSRLVIPAFAFVTFYSLIVILFASAYRLISLYTSQAHFRVGDALRGLSFSEAMYFSIGTVSTVGYGDIIPYSNLARVLSSVEVFCGIMLLMFGVSELLEYARERRQGRPQNRDKRR
jgi:voltage-gated potassium channel